MARAEVAVSELLAEGKAFANLSAWRKIAFSGADAFDWLNDLVSADLSGLSAGRARRSLLLSPTGQVRAVFTVSVREDHLLALQDPDQRSVADLLSPYVLSSHVEIEDRTDRLALFALPGRTEPPDAAGASSSAPSCLGAGVDLIAPREDGEHMDAALSESFARAEEEDVEAWRVAAGIPRLGVDVLDGDLPQEAGLEEAVAFDKGCYLGQEAVAKVRNLGHPRRVLVRFQADTPVAPGDPVLAGREEVGTVTSVAPTAMGVAGLARVRWDARESALVSAGGARLLLRPPG